MSNTPVAGKKGGRSEFGVALLLLALGVWAIVDALGVTDTVSRGAVDARTVPIVVGGLLILMAVLLTVDLIRGGRGEQEGGEDVDLSHGSDWKTIGLLASAFAANALLIERLGWPVSGAVLFFGATYALGSRRYVLNALISVGLSVGTWYLFNLALGIPLPVGILKGIL
jgi:putative tricarboxylic transport membrane protein